MDGMSSLVRLSFIERTSTQKQPTTSTEGAPENAAIVFSPSNESYIKNVIFDQIKRLHGIPFSREEMHPFPMPSVPTRITGGNVEAGTGGLV